MIFIMFLLKIGEPDAAAADITILLELEVGSLHQLTSQDLRAVCQVICNDFYRILIRLVMF